MQGVLTDLVCRCKCICLKDGLFSNIIDKKKSKREEQSLEGFSA